VTFVKVLRLYIVMKRPLTLKEEHGLQIFQNKVLRKTLGAKMGEISG